MSQADYFLKKSRLRKGDLPPMLDVELSDRRIAAMGGRDVLFREMLVWLKEVGRRSGTTPIIYVSQDFVNRYMPFAPEELKKYPVWVARYGEYKPYVHCFTGSSRPTVGYAVSGAMWTSTCSTVRRSSSRGICGRKP